MEELDTLSSKPYYKGLYENDAYFIHFIVFLQDQLINFGTQVSSPDEDSLRNDLIYLDSP